MADSELSAYRRARRDAPLGVLRASPDWQPVVDLFRHWTARPLDETCSYGTEELDACEKRQGWKFPMPRREWWRLAGRHPFVREGMIDCSIPGPAEADLLRQDGCDGQMQTVTIDDGEIGARNGILETHSRRDNPPVHARNPTITPVDAPTLKWVAGAFFETGLDVARLMHATLLWQLCQRRSGRQTWHVIPSSSVLRLDRRGLEGGVADPALITALGLRRYTNPCIVGDVFSDKREFIYHWLLGIACRTDAAAERVRKIIGPARSRSGA